MSLILFNKRPLPALTHLFVWALLLLSTGASAQPFTLSESDQTTAINASRVDPEDAFPGGLPGVAGGADGASGARMSLSQDLTARCGRDAGHVFQLKSGAALKRTSGCSGGGFEIAYCESRVADAGVCQDSDWSDPVQLKPQSSVSVGDAEVTLRNCRDGRCTIGVTERVSVVRDPERTKREGQRRVQALQRGAASNEGDIAGSAVYNLGSSPEFQAAFEGTGKESARGAHNIRNGAQENRIVDGAGEDLGELTGFSTEDCPERCVDQTTREVTKQRSCKQETAVESYACVESYGTAACVTQPRTEDRTCTRKRDIDYGSCRFRWIDHAKAPRKIGCTHQVLEQTPVGGDWVKRNTFDREYNGSKQLITWRQGYVLDNGFKTSCEAAGDSSCQLVQTACTDAEAQNGSIQAGFDCVEQTATYACRTGGVTDSCGVDGTEDDRLCEQTESLTCSESLALDTKVCHSERGRVLPKYQCPAGFDHLPESNICVGQKFCPDDYSLDENGQCVLAGNEYCETQSYAPNSLGFIDIISQEFTDPFGDPINAQADFQSDSDQFILNFETTHSDTYCGTGWNYTLTFRVDDIREMHQFVLRETRWNDRQEIFVNGEKVYESGGSCEGGNSGQAAQNQDLKPYMHDGLNTLRIKGTSGPDTFRMYARFVIQRECVFGGTCPFDTSSDPSDPANCTAQGEPLNQRASDYLDGFQSGDNPISCALESRTRNQDDPNRFIYDCGQQASATSSCTDEELEGFTEANRFNERENDAGTLISWDQLYTRNRRFETNGVCRADRAGSSCELVEETCVNRGPTKMIDGVPVEGECFERERRYQCNGAFDAGYCQSESPQASCEPSGSSCISTDPDTGECLATQIDYICRDQVTDSTCAGTPPAQAQCTEEIETCVRTDQHGNCLSTKTTQSCYSSETPRCNTRDACSFKSQECIRKENGICLEVSQLYSCEETETTCSERSAVCEEGGSGEGEPFGRGFNSAVAGLAKADGLMKTIQSDGLESDLRVMTGKAVSCSDDFVGEPVAAKCCNRNADQSGFFASCNQEEKDLAAAKRADRTVFVDRYCSEEVDLGFTTLCITRRSTYCQFPSLLARIVQEQGRAQLGAMSRAPRQPPSVDRGTSSYMGEQGGWRQLMRVQGQPVYVYRWSRTCETDPTKAYADSGLVCPAEDEVVVAYCASGDCSRSSLGNPYQPNADSGFVYGRYRAAGDTGVSLGRAAQMSGSCNAVRDTREGRDSFGQCRTTITSWPVATGGNAQVSMDISWQLFHPEGNPDHWSATAKQFGRFTFQPYQADVSRNSRDERVAPDSVPLRVSVDGGPARTIRVPTHTPESGYRLPTSPETRLFGSCDPDLNWCDMTVIAQADIGARPFCTSGTCKESRLDCGGFTMEEFAVLDFSEMDLDEYTSSLSPDIPSSNELASRASQTGNEFKDQFESKGTTTSKDTGQAVMQATPTDGRPPWTVHLNLVGEYPGTDQSHDVDRIRIEWGDGTSDTVRPSGNNRISRDHTYREGSGFRDFYLTATYYLENGRVRTSRAKLNSWENNPPRNSSSYGGGSGTAGQYTPSETPSGQFSSDLPSTRVPESSDP